MMWTLPASTHTGVEPPAQECAHAYHISGLLVKLLLSQAQTNGLEFQVDTHALESEWGQPGLTTAQDECCVHEGVGSA